MPEETKHGIECAEFEALLSSVLDGAMDDPVKDGDASKLNSTQRERFDAHRRVCAICGPMFAEVGAGRQWLRSLEPVEPPAYLVHNILAATSGVLSTRSFSAASAARAASRHGRSTPLAERLRERWDAFFTPAWAFVRQPRFAMSFGMIFFSFSLGLNAAGVKASDVAKVNLRPSALRHAYIDAEVKVVKYYDNIRFVYEIESKLRELKRANSPVEPGPAYKKDEPKDKHNNTSGQPDQNQDRNYSQEYTQPVLAALRSGSSVSPVLRDGVGRAQPDVTASLPETETETEILSASLSATMSASLSATGNRRFV